MLRQAHCGDARPGSAERISPCSRRDFRPAAWQDRSLAWLGAMLTLGPAMLGQNPCRLRAAMPGPQAGTKNRRPIQPNKERTMDRANPTASLRYLGKILYEAKRPASHPARRATRDVSFRCGSGRGSPRTTRRNALAARRRTRGVDSNQVAWTPLVLPGSST
jgi:hypothetical protein